MTVPSLAATSRADLAADAAPSHVALSHPVFVRVTHWLTTLATIALVISGVELIISHPRFYWGEIGNVNTPALFSLPIPASRATVPSGYAFTMPDQNGWSRSLHFQSAWLVLFTGAAYVLMALRTGHLVQRLLPRPGDRNWPALRDSIAAHRNSGSVNVHRPGEYNVLQRVAYLSVLLVLLPGIVWTGLAMSPGFTAVFPWSVTLLGGHQSARTLHFALMLALLAFVAMHVLMVARAGFWRLVRSMVTGSTEASR